MPQPLFQSPPKYGDSDNTLLGKLWYALSGDSGQGVPSEPGAVATNTGSNQNNSFSQTSASTAAVIAIGRPTRRGIIFTNTDAANSVEVSTIPGFTYGQGYRILPGASVTVTCTQAWYIADSGSHALVSVSDEWD